MASRTAAADYERPRQVALEERGNVSLRGAYHEFSHRFRNAIRDFHCVRTLATGGVYSSGSDLATLPHAVVGRVVAAAYGESHVALLDDLEDDGIHGGAHYGRTVGGGDCNVAVGGSLGLNFRVMLRRGGGHKKAGSFCDLQSCRGFRA